MPPTLYIAVALLTVVVLRKFIPVSASILGISISLAIATWGIVIYSQGGGMSFFGAQLSPVAFFCFVGVLTGFEALNLYVAIRRRRQRIAQGSSE